MYEMKYLPLFTMPKTMKITGRSSSITNAFINSIIPSIQPTEEQVKQVLSILGMLDDSFQCSYCGASASEWDHLMPLVVDKKPTGYISEIHNLVPSCGKCNQSKGNKDWREWIVSDAKLSPKSKGIQDLDERIRRLEAFKRWAEPTRLDIEAIIGPELWEQHWENWERVQAAMRHSQDLSEKIKESVGRAFKLR